MSTKLTLTIEKSVIEKAKKHALRHGLSLSEIIENYLKAITANEQKDVEEISPIVRSLKGSFKMPKDFDYKKELSDALTRKYLKS